MTPRRQNLALALVLAVTIAGMLGAAFTADAYNRREWRHWTDADGDRLSTREEVLEQESLVPVLRHSGKIVQGLWLCPYSYEATTDPGDLDVDHLIPLSYADEHGGATWSVARKELFANDLGDRDHLVAVVARYNRQKGAKGPSKWMPPKREAWCWYAHSWRRIAIRYGLVLEQADWTRIAEALDTCP